MLKYAIIIGIPIEWLMFCFGFDREHRQQVKIINLNHVATNCPEVLESRHLIPVRLAVRVSVVHVLTVGSRVREALKAFGALERFLAAVQSLVLRQMVLVLERFRTVDALVRTLA